MENDKYQKKLIKSAKTIVENDGKIISSLYENGETHNGVFALMILPRIALFCREAQEFYKKTVVESDVDNK